MKVLKISFRSFFITIASLSVFSCTDVLKNTYSKKTAEGDLERILAIGRLDSSDYEMLTDYMLRNGLIEPDLKHIDQTYLNLLESARTEKLKLDLVKVNAKKIKDSKKQFVPDHMDHMHNALIMVPEKSEIRKDWSSKNSFLYTMVFVNPSDRTIRAFRGKFAFYDLFDTEIKTINLTFNDSIPASDTVKHVANIDLSHLSNNTIYVTQDYKDLKVVWQPLKILYTDGTTLE